MNVSKPKEVLTDEPVMGTINPKNEVATWQEIADWLSESDGVTIRSETVRANYDMTVKKLRKELVRFPEIKEWLESHGIDWRDFA